MADSSSAANAPKDGRDGDQNTRGRGRGGRGQSRGRGRGGFKGDGDRRKKEMGRGERKRETDKRSRNDEDADRGSKRQRIEGGGSGAVTSSNPFTKEEIDAEGRKPKRKVAVLVGYAGSGYKGMQINATEKTIEGDLFTAFVAAGAISRANADDPKKSSLVRCARTDKGVHAAGNVISLKLIVEEPNIVESINANLPPQIRVWGIERTNGAFSCYQTCDSRWYEYLIPTYCFLPPHPKSYLGEKLVECAEKEGIFETYQSLQEDVANFWKEVDEVYAKPIIDKLDPELREAVMAEIHSYEDKTRSAIAKEAKAAVVADSTTKPEDMTKNSVDHSIMPDTSADVASTQSVLQNDENAAPNDIINLNVNVCVASTKPVLQADGDAEITIEINIGEDGTDWETATLQGTEVEQIEEGSSLLTPLESAIKEVKAAYIKAKKAYRISESRRQRLQDALNCYLGTRNFHNYTIQKAFSDPSAKRVIRSFQVGKDPVYINDTEWLSLKVHGQSFMMHQIRKMVAMAALVVRCGTSEKIIHDSYGPANISIPKAPSLGLLLERPVFETYNEKAVKQYNKEKLDFDKFKTEMDEFKQREIYDRIFREEEKEHQFHSFFHHIDHIRTDYFLWVTASGLSAAKQSKAASRTDDPESDDETVDVNGQEG